MGHAWLLDIIAISFIKNEIILLLKTICTAFHLKHKKNERRHNQFVKILLISKRDDTSVVCILFKINTQEILHTHRTHHTRHTRLLSQKCTRYHDRKSYDRSLRSLPNPPSLCVV